jgi:hypothetical protein
LGISQRRVEAPVMEQDGRVLEQICRFGAERNLHQVFGPAMRDC